jgi:ATP-binding cassette subfamily B multidrug efflux pump
LVCFDSKPSPQFAPEHLIVTAWSALFGRGTFARHLTPAEIPTGLLAQLRRNTVNYSIGILLLAAYNYAQYWIDLLLADAMSGMLHGELSKSRVLGMGMAFAGMLAFIARVLSRLTIFNAGRFAEYELRTALLHHLHRLGPSFYRRMSTGDIMSRVTNDLQQVRGLLGFGVLNLFNTSFGLVSALAVMLGFSVKLTIASLAPLPLLLLVMRAYSKRMYVRQRENQDSLGHLGGMIQSSIAGVRVVRAFSLEEAQLAGFDRVNHEYLDKGLILAKIRGSMWPVMQSITMLGVLIVFLYGGQLIVRGEFKAEQFLSFYRALFRLTWPLAALGFLVSVLQRGRAGYARLRDIFDARPDVVDGQQLPERLDGKLEIRDLSFGYSDLPVLRGLSLQVQPGERVAIVGRTGSGKSTLGALLSRLHTTPRGSVFLDGVDVCDLPLATLRSSVLYNQQLPFLFSTTVGRNVGYSLEHPEGEDAERQIRAAARDAQILDEIEALPEGFDTVVGERGVQLSGGQKQRVAIARALLAQPKVLVLDDPLSAVDARTEKALLDALDEQLARERSLILITHRVSAAARCDRVLVFDRGQVVEAGTHEELARAGGLYARFVEEQRRESELSKLNSDFALPKRFNGSGEAAQ